MNDIKKASLNCIKEKKKYYTPYISELGTIKEHTKAGGSLTGDSGAGMSTAQWMNQ